MHRVPLLGELCPGEVFLKAACSSAVAQGPPILAVKEKLLFGIPPLKPAPQGEECIIRKVDHPPHVVLLSLNELDLSIPEIEIVEGEAEGFTDPDAGPQQKQEEGPVSCVMDD